MLSSSGHDYFTRTATATVHGQGLCIEWGNGTILVYRSSGRTAHAQCIGHSHQFRKRFCPHFAHDIAAVNFDGDFADPEFPGNLLVHKSGGDPPHDLLLAAGERVEARLELGGIAGALAPVAVALEADLHRIEHVLIAKRFRQELDG